MNLPNDTILIVDDDPDVLLAAQMVLKQEFARVLTESDPANLEALLAREEIDVVLLDMNFVAGVTTGQEGLDWLGRIKTWAPATNIILMTAYGGVDLAIRGIKAGASDFVVKPWDNARLIATVNSALRYSRSTREVQQLKTRQALVNRFVDQDRHQIIGESEALAEVLASIEKVAATDANVLILGENGTGKELVARALHSQSQRSDQAFVSIDIGAIAESLFESELFGHTRGAFTDAKTDRPGRFEVASGGTLFLDEIGNLNVQMQAKLLGVLETRSLTRLGSDRPVNVDVRLVSATNMPLYDMVEDFQFRQDLLYRLNTVEIRLPPLRERKTDIPVLAEHFMAQFCRKYNKPGLTLAQSSLKKLQDYHWPGNIRELQHAIERAVIMAESNTLEADNFVLEKPASRTTVDANLNLEQVEKETIKKALIKYQGNLSKAATELGLGRSTLYRKMNKYGL